VAVAIAAGLLSTRTPTLPRPLVPKRLTLALSQEAKLDATIDAPFALSADGRRLVYMGLSDGRRRLYLRPLEALDAAPARHRGRRQRRLLARREVGGVHGGHRAAQGARRRGEPEPICEPGAIRGMSWGDDGWIVLGMMSSGLVRVRPREVRSSR